MNTSFIFKMTYQNEIIINYYILLFIINNQCFICHKRDLNNSFNKNKTNNSTLPSIMDIIHLHIKYLV